MVLCIEYRCVVTNGYNTAQDNLTQIESRGHSQVICILRMFSNCKNDICLLKRLESCLGMIDSVL